MQQFAQLCPRPKDPRLVVPAVTPKHRKAQPVILVGGPPDHFPRFLDIRKALVGRRENECRDAPPRYESVIRL